MATEPDRVNAEYRAAQIREDRLNQLHAEVKADAIEAANADPDRGDGFVLYVNDHVTSEQAAQMLDAYRQRDFALLGQLVAQTSGLAKFVERHMDDLADSHATRLIELRHGIQVWF